MPQDIQDYLARQPEGARQICERLQSVIADNFADAENKVWHAHPVWFLAGNPIVGYSTLKSGVRLMFWSGADFNGPGLIPGTGKFKDASITYQSADEVDEDAISRWLAESREIQWDYKNIVKNKGHLTRIS